MALTVQKDVFGESVEIRMEEIERLKTEGANIKWSHSSATEINSWINSVKICLCERILYIPQVRVVPTKNNIERNPEVEEIDCGHDAICQRLNAKFFAVRGNEWFCKKGIRVEDIPVSKKHPELACACSTLFSNNQRGECLTDTDARVASIRAQMGPEKLTSYQSSAMYEGIAKQPAVDSVNFSFTWAQTSVASGSGTNANDQQEFPPGVNGMNTGQDLDNMSWLLFDSEEELNVAYETARHQEPNFETFLTGPLSEMTGQSASALPLHMDFAATAEIDPANREMILDESELVSLQSVVQAPPRSSNPPSGASAQIFGQSASYGLGFARFAEGNQLQVQNNLQMQLTRLDAYQSFMAPYALPAAAVQRIVGGLSNSVRPLPHTHDAATSDRPFKILELKRKRDAQSLPLSRHLTREFDPNRPDLGSIETLQQLCSPPEATVESFDWLLDEDGSTRSSSGLNAIVGPLALSSDISRVSNQNDNDGAGDTNAAKDPFQYDFL